MTSPKPNEPHSDQTRGSDETRRATISCPPVETLSLMLSETEAISTDLASHVETCQLCLEQLDKLSDSQKLTEYRKFARELRDTTRDLDPTNQPGEMGVLAGMRVIDVIGRGGMGVVYRCRDKALERDVAVKLLPRESSIDSLSRFDREARAAAKLKHDHIVPIFQAGRTERGQPYLVMPLIQGSTLKARLERNGQALGIPLDEALKIVQQIALGLEAAHQAGMIHRDVKPGNILLDREDGRAKLSDFGLVRNLADERLTQGNVICGTPSYMSPEQIADPDSQDARGDIYSLGVVLYECLTGSPPYRGMPMEIMDQHRNATPVPPRQMNARIPADVQNICLKAVAQRPGERYQSAREFADDLQRFQDGKPVTAREVTQFQLALNWCNRHRALTAMFFLSVTLLLILAIGSTLAAFQFRRANNRIMEEKNKAEAAETAAQQDRAAALTSLESLVDSLYAELSEGPATIRTRDKVVSAALKGLETLSKQPGDERADKTRFRALVRMGDLAALRRDHDFSEQQYLAAIDVANQRVQATPNSSRELKDLAMVQSKLAEQLFSRLDERHKLFAEKTRSTLNHVLEMDPTDPNAQLQLLAIETIELEAERLASPGDPGKLIGPGTQALEKLDHIREDCDDQVAAAWLSQRLGFLVGRAHLESYQPKTANELFVQAENELSFLMESSPENPLYRGARATLARARGMALGALGNLKEARSCFQTAASDFEELSRADPENRQIAFNSASTQLVLGMGFQFSGEFDEAITAYRTNIQIYESYLEQQPEDPSAMNQAVIGQLRLIDCLLNAGDLKDGPTSRLLQADEQVQQMLTRAGDKLMPAMRKQAEELLAILLLFRTPDATSSTAIHRLRASYWILLTDAISNESAELAPPSIRELRQLWPELESEEFDGVFQFLAAEMEPYPELEIEFRLFQTRVYGLLARNQATASDAARQGQSAASIKSSLDALQKLAKLAPIQLNDGIMNDPHLIWLRQQQAFQDRWSSIMGDVNRSP